MKEAIAPDGWRTYPGVSQAIRVGNTVHLSGQVAIDEQGNLVGKGDPEAQAAQCFRNIETVLAAAGATASDVVKLTCFLADRSAFGAYTAAKAEFLGDAVAPAGTAVIVAGLASPEILMEVDVIAEISDSIDRTTAEKSD